MLSKPRPGRVEVVTAIALIAAPFILPYLGSAPNTVNRILVWGLFGIGFDILFGYTGLLSFGQAAFYGTGGMVTAYLLTRAGFPHVITALVIGMVAAAVVGYLVGLIALRRTGIYFAMITVAIGEVFFFVEFNPLSHWTAARTGCRGTDSQHPPGPHQRRLHDGLESLSVPRVLLLRGHRDRASHRALARRHHLPRDPGKSVARRRGGP